MLINFFQRDRKIKVNCISQLQIGKLANFVLTLFWKPRSRTYHTTIRISSNGTEYLTTSVCIRVA